MRRPSLPLWVLLGGLLLPAATATPAFGQAAILVALFGEKVASENFYFSIKGGVNLSNLTGGEDTDIRLGANFGMLANIRLSDRWSLVPEFMPLSTKGASGILLRPSGIPELDDLLENSTSTNTTLKFIDMVVVLEFRPSPKWYLGAGPQFNYLRAAEDVFRAKVVEDDDLTYREDIKDALRSWDFGVVFEVGYTLLEARAGRGLTFHLRYALGLTDLVKDNPGDAVRTSVLQLSLSLPFLAQEDHPDGP